MDNTIIQQGSFTSDGTAHTIILRSDVDWMRVYNYTAADGATSGDGCIYYWQRGMTDGGGLYEYHPAADQTLAINAIAAGSGFYYIDTSATSPSAAVAITGATNATQPVVSTASTSGLANGDIVRLSSVTGAESIGGWDFAIDTLVANTSFRMAYAMQQAPGAAGTAGYWRRIPYDPIFYPRWRNIVNITAAASAVVTCSVPHGYTVGQKVRINLPDTRFGMVEINGLSGTITAVGAVNTFTLDIDSSGFTAFTFALPASVPFSMPTVVPLGIDTGTAISGAVDILADATYNSAYIGMKLMPGAAGPGGNTSDVMYWVAGKSFSNLAE